MKFLVIEKLPGKPVDRMNIELVERKGIGHPDHIIDSMCEAVSRGLSRFYIKEYGLILHHNIDKGLLVGGEAQPKFGGGNVLKPIEIYIAGRATIPDDNYNIVDEIALESAIKDVNDNFRFLDPLKHMDINIKIRRGASSLQSLLKRKEIPLANDTSFGIGYAPLSPAEKLALGIEQYLNSQEIKNEYPYIGEDVKVMVLRKKKKMYVTVASAFIDKYITDIKDYKKKKQELLNLIIDFAEENLNKDYKINVALNTADDIKNKEVYLTVTGTSAEMGDDGNTGRGNRVNGLITPNRFMSLEATAGKNPVSHVGKIYNVLANYLSNEIYNDLGEYIEEVYVRILSQIGKKITEPQVLHVLYRTKRNINLDKDIRNIIEEKFTYENIKKLTNDILEGKFILF